MSRKSEGTSSNTSITFLGLLQLAFIILKVSNVINWSWWAVFIPLWLELILILLIILLSLIIYILSEKTGE